MNKTLPVWIISVASLFSLGYLIWKDIKKQRQLNQEMIAKAKSNIVVPSSSDHVNRNIPDYDPSTVTFDPTRYIQ